MLIDKKVHKSLMEKIVIIGTGPAGLTAAIYAARAGLDPLIIEGYVPGGQLTVSHAVENYPGFPDAVSGAELMMRFRKQAERFAIRFRKGAVTGIEGAHGYFKLQVRNSAIDTRTVIIATGAQARRLTVPGEEKYYGRGVSGCVTCDGPFFAGKTVAVVGGGNSAMHDALYLTNIAARIIIIHRRKAFRADLYEIEKLRGNPKVEWMVPWVVDKVIGDTTVTGIMVKNSEDGTEQMIHCDGVFVAIGHDPMADIFKNVVAVDTYGYISVSRNSMRTSAPGIFACGDVCDPVYRQAAVAVGQGCMAAMDAQQYLEKEEWHA